MPVKRKELVCYFLFVCLLLLPQMYFFIMEGIKFLIMKWHDFEGHVILLRLILNQGTIPFM